MNARVTVVIPAYNAARYLNAAIDSVRRQSFPDWLMLIINDASSDDTPLIAEKAASADPRITVISNPVNRGISEARNQAVSMVKTDYIAWLDADDIAHEERLQRQVRFLDSNPQIDLLATRLCLMDKHGVITGIWPEDYHVTREDAIRKTLPVINCIGQSTVMVRTAVMKKYRYERTGSEDWSLWLRFLENGHRIAKLREVLVRYRVHEGGLTVADNARGVQRKIILFKYRFMLRRLREGCAGGVTAAVFVSFMRDLLKFIFPRFFLRLLRHLRDNPLRLLSAFLRVSAILRRKHYDRIFIFPYWHTGGAEKVHAAVTAVTPPGRNLVVITGSSSDNAFEKDFRSNADVIEADRLLMFSLTYKWLVRMLKSAAGERTVFFGSNSRFLYELAQMEKISGRFADLIHAFVHEYEDGPEKWSLPCIPRLEKRVVITEAVRHELERQYALKGISPGYLDRIRLVTNFTPQVPLYEKDYNGKLVALYSGRGGEEKRIELISAAARICGQANLPFEFHFAGDAEYWIPEEDKGYCVLHGMITDSQRMSAIYNSAHVLLLSSSREGFPMVIMEAMMHGVVPVVVPTGGIPDHVNNSNGVLIPSSGDIVSHFYSVLSELSGNREKLRELSEAARAYANENFSYDRFKESYRRLFND